MTAWPYAAGMSGTPPRTVDVNGKPVLVDSEGYLVRPSDWSDAFVRAWSRVAGAGAPGIPAEHAL